MTYFDLKGPEKYFFCCTVLLLASNITKKVDFNIKKKLFNRFFLIKIKPVY